MIRFVEACERFIIMALVVMMIVAVLLSTIELGWIMVDQIASPPFFLLDIKELFELFGFFLMVLIGIELLQSVKTYLRSSQIHVEVVFMVAMIAIARKVIILNLHEVSGLSLIGLAATIFALATGYFVVKKADKPDALRDQPK